MMGSRHSRTSELAPYACAHSRGRCHPQSADPFASLGSDFELDALRVVHSTAFRRLALKTQVFLSHEGDLFRSRLTHSLEVAQIGRSMARSLGLNADLVEAIALAHDLGHTPFGHTGQEALDACMSRWGGFEHNAQSLRVVDTLELSFASFEGLNLTFETRQGLLKHCSVARALMLCEIEPDGPARQFLEGTQPSLEAQLCNLADEIAYNTHDIDDGVRSGLIECGELRELELIEHARQDALVRYPHLREQPKRLMSQTLRQVLAAQVADVIGHSQQAIAACALTTFEAVKTAGPLVVFGASMQERLAPVRGFLHERLYRHPQLERTMAAAREVVVDLFEGFLKGTFPMPPSFAQRPDRARAVADYIAGMTDRYALREHYRFTGRDLGLGGSLGPVFGALSCGPVRRGEVGGACVRPDV